MTHRLGSAAIAVIFLAACATPSMGEDGEPQGSTTSKLMPSCGAALNDVDGVVAHSNGWAETSGESCAGSTAEGTLLYQCVEFAQRYMNQRFGTQLVWPVQYAAQMCNSNVAGTTVHWVSAGYQPKHGDLVVWQVNTYGHVAVVKDAAADNITIVEQNGGNSPNGTRALARSDGFHGAACFISADSAPTPDTTPATTPATPDPADSKSSACRFGNGLYCGGNGAGTDSNALYRCSSGLATVVEQCAQGCEWMPDRQNDRCRTNTMCPHGNGNYCGGNGISGDPSILFSCNKGRGITTIKRCTNGCRQNAPGWNDECDE